MKTDIFNLSIIPVADILPHEKFDEKRAAPLVSAMKRDGFIANPIIVTAIDETTYLQLDGMNRFTAFKKMDYPAIVCQIIDYDDQDEVELSNWVHLFAREKNKFLEKVSRIQSITVREGKPEHVRHRYIKEEGNALLATLVSRKGEVYQFIGSGSLKVKISALNQIVSLYEQKITRDVLPAQPQKGSLDLLFAEHLSDTLMLIFPTFTRHQIVSAVQNKILFPPGITRHIIKRRCLNVNLPLSFFDGQKTIEEQNKLLEERIKVRKFRLYEEPTIYFE